MARRKPKSKYQSTEDAVRAIMKRISMGCWVRNVSEFAFADKHGYTVESVLSYVREARRRVAAGVAFDDELRASILAQLEVNTEIMHDIYRRAKEDPDTWGTAVAAVKAKNDSLRIMCGLTKRKEASEEFEDDLKDKSERELNDIIEKVKQEKCES